MIMILIALIALIALAIWGTTKEWSFFSDFICPLFAACGFIGLMAYSVLVYSYVAAEYQAGILNAEYGTNYTQAEVFYASNVIDTVRQLDRKRIELNGNLITGE